MKLKFCLLSLFVLGNVINIYAHYEDDDTPSNGVSGNTMIVSLRSINNTDKTSEAIILDTSGKEVGRIHLSFLDFYLEFLSAGEYTIVYTDSQGNVLNQTQILIK